MIAGILDKILSVVTVFLLGIMAVGVNLGVFYRYVLAAALPWSEEIPKFCMIYMGFLGTAIALRRDQHIGFYALIQRLPDKLQVFFKLFGYFLIGFFLIVLVKWGFYLAFAVGFSSVTPKTHITYVYLLIAVPIAGIFMMIQLLMKILFVLLSLLAAH